jgi:hypothetical protein
MHKTYPTGVDLYLAWKARLMQAEEFLSAHGYKGEVKRGNHLANAVRSIQTTDDEVMQSMGAALIRAPKLTIDTIHVQQKRILTFFRKG